MVSRNISRFFLLMLLGIVAACAPKPPPPPPPAPPPPPPVIVIPPVPTPPNYSAANFQTPPIGMDGRRITPNTGIGEFETVWHMRSALNVAALNCTTLEHAALTDNYNQFLETHKIELRNVNNAIEAKFRRENGSDYRRVRDTHSTQVYNFFSLPPVKAEFCDAALGVSQQLLITPTDQLSNFSYGGLRQLEDVFERFFAEYDQYKRDLSAWYIQYAPDQAPASTYAVDTQVGDVYTAGTVAGAPIGGTSPSTGPISTTTLPASSAASPGPATDPFSGYSPSAPSGDAMQSFPQPTIITESSGATVQPLPGETAAPAASSGAMVQPLPGDAPAQTPPNAVIQPTSGDAAVSAAPSGAMVQPIPGQEAPASQPPVTKPTVAQPPVAEPTADGAESEEDVWVTANGDAVGTSDAGGETAPAEEPQR